PHHTHSRLPCATLPTRRSYDLARQEDPALRRIPSMTFAAPTNSRLLRKLPGHTAPLVFSARLPFQGCCAASEDSEVDVLRRQPLDRKSTRLNYSHQIISYAVFC